MTFQKLTSLGFRFLMVNMLVAAVPLTVFLWFTVPRTEDTLANTLRSSLKTKASIAAYGIDRFLKERVVEATVLSQADVLESDDIEARIQYLTEIVEATPWIDDIDIIGVDGVIICSSGDQNEKGLLASEVLRGSGPALIAAVKGRQGDVFVSEAIEIDSGTGLCFITPITDDSNENVVSLLLAEVNLTAIEPLLNQFLEHLKDYGAKSVCLVDNDGRVIVSAGSLVTTFTRHPDLAVKPDLLTNFETQEAVGSIIYQDVQGDEVVAGYADLGEFGKNEALDWSIIATVSLSEWSSGFSNTANQSLLFLLASSLVAVSIGAAMSWSVVRRIGLLSNATAAVSRGDLSQEIPIQSDDEIGLLSRSFNQMTQTLRETRTKLESEAADKDAQATLATLMRDAEDIHQLGNRVTAFVANHSGSQMSAFYVLPLGEGDGDGEGEGEGRGLRLVGNYAFPLARSERNSVDGEELVSQAARSKKSILISDVPEGYIKVTSGLGEAIPRNVLVIPLLDGVRIKGVIELGSFGSFSDKQIIDIERLVRPVAAAISAKQGAEKIQSLLTSTQDQAADLEAANKEMKTLSMDQQDAIDRNNETVQQLELANNQIQEALSAAEVATRSKSEFLANMSHEIRTPMTAILGFTDMLLDDLTKAENIDAANTIRTNGSYLLGLINDILDLSKVESGKLELEQAACSPRSIVADVRELMQVRSAEKGLQLEVHFDGPIPVTIQTDPTRLRQILINVLGNAIKFTELGSVQIVTRLLQAQEEKPKLQIDVIDSGIGIPEDKIEKLFLPFTQADNSTTRRFGGTGLGLTICKRLAELLGGEISVSSTVGKGSTFSITIDTGPLDGVKLLEGSSEPTRETKAKSIENVNAIQLNCRILLAEDTPFNQKIISKMLKKVGCDVIVADNGQIAVEKALASQEAGQPFDVVLMDMQMPVMDGYDATGRLRDAGFSQPIIALTAHAMSGDRKKCLDAGCDEYVTKPVERKKLFEVIRGLTDTQNKSSSEENTSRSELLNTTTQDLTINGKVLLVEDGPDNQRLITLLLKKAGAEVTLAKNGSEGYEAAFSAWQTGAPFGVVLMDMHMPVMDGYKATRKLREAGYDGQIVALTAHSLNDEIDECLAAGCDTYLSKPIDRATFISEVAGRMGQRSGCACQSPLDAIS